jgi:hypothetical protein
MDAGSVEIVFFAEKEIVLMCLLRSAIIVSLAVVLCWAAAWGQDKSPIHPFEVVDTGQISFFDNAKTIPKPLPGQPFFGQDAQFLRNPPKYSDNGDGTITDDGTGLIWQKSFAVMSYDEAVQKVKAFALAGKQDWRLPGIKEIYSLAFFSRRRCQQPANDGSAAGCQTFYRWRL